MPWFKVDDNLAIHPKVIRAGNTALGLWVRAGSWSAQQLTEGFIPSEIVMLMQGDDVAPRLVEAGLWADAPGGYRFHDWDERQPSKESVLADRAAARERQRKARDLAKSRRESRRDEPVTHAEVTPPPEEPAAAPTTKPAGRQRGTRLEADWTPSRELVDQMRTECPGVDLQAEHRVFTDYWIAQPGSKGTKLDWEATWRNWMRRKHGDTNSRPTPTQRAEATLRLATDLDTRELEA